MDFELRQLPKLTEIKSERKKRSGILFDRQTPACYCSKAFDIRRSCQQKANSPAAPGVHRSVTFEMYILK